MFPSTPARIVDVHEMERAISQKIKFGGKIFREHAAVGMRAADRAVQWNICAQRLRMGDGKFRVGSPNRKSRRIWFRDPWMVAVRGRSVSWPMDAGNRTPRSIHFGRAVWFGPTTGGWDATRGNSRDPLFRLVWLSAVRELGPHCGHGVFHRLGRGRRFRNPAVGLACFAVLVTGGGFLRDRERAAVPRSPQIGFTN